MSKSVYVNCCTIIYKILEIYWQKIERLNKLIELFNNSKSKEKKQWAHLINNVFNSDNNIIFSDGNKITILWGWKFNSKYENKLFNKNIVKELEKEKEKE